tara:strand:- start:286 stop:483 length:198 start_codon:yes stop_codon:yes gene_type:complete
MSVVNTNASLLAANGPDAIKKVMCLVCSDMVSAISFDANHTIFFALKQGEYWLGTGNYARLKNIR